MTSIARTLWSALRGTAIGIFESYRLGFRSMVLAPTILVLAALTELAQHIIEINIGMFDSLEAARRLQSSAIREYVGYPKVAAVWIAAFLIVRFWSKRSAKAAVVVPLHILGKAAIGIAAIIAVGFVVVKSLAMVSPQLGIIATLLSGVIQAMLFLWTIGVWLDDDPIAIKTAFSSRAPSALSLLVIFLFSVPAAQGAHLLIHKAVLGQPQPVVWSLMLFDALIIVPLSAALNGAALFVGYRSGATWRGWDKDPMDEANDRHGLP